MLATGGRISCPPFPACLELLKRRAAWRLMLHGTIWKAEALSLLVGLKHVPDLAQEAQNRSLPLPARLGALEALAALASGHGRSLASVAPESLALGTKHAARSASADAPLTVLYTRASFCFLAENN